MKFLTNLALRMLLIWGFAQLGWMSFRVHGEPLHGFGWLLLFAFLGGILLAILTLVLIIPYSLLGMVATVFTFGLFLIIFDTVFYSLLIWLISLIFPANVQMHGFWLTVLCGAILSFVTWLVNQLFRDDSD